MTDQPLTVLAIECSTRACSVALRRDGRLRADISAEGRGQAEALIPAIGEIMVKSGLAWPDIDLIAVSVGPGSFTGLRIGLAAARGLALARRIPVAGVTTADLLAHGVATGMLSGRGVLVAIDSKRDDIFVQPFDEDLRPTAEIRALTAEQALQWQSGPLLVTGDAADRFQGLRDDLEIDIRLPSASDLSELAEIRYRAGQALPAHPLYLRPPDVTLPGKP